MKQELTVGEVSRRSGIAISALHFYETRGLIASTRTAGNQRRYRRDVLRRLAIIQVGQQVGIPLADIRAAFDALPEGRTPDHEDWERLSATWRNELTRRIEQITRLRDDLTGCIGCGCLSLETCALRNPDDRLALTGAGPRRLLVEPLTRCPV